jgi:hypothetical protein
LAGETEVLGENLPQCYFFFTGSTAPVGPGLFFSFMIILQTVGLLGRVISSSQGLYLNTGQHKHRMNTYTHQTSKSCVGFEPTILASKRAKTVHPLDRSAAVIGPVLLCSPQIPHDLSCARTLAAAVGSRRLTA